MAVYGNMVLTQQGLALYTKAQSGVQLNFTRMQIGSGQLAVGQDPTTLTALITPISFFNINSISSSGSTAYVKGIFENTSVTVSTYSCELGLFATDPTLGEILFAYANAGAQGDTIPPISAGPFSKQYQINAAIGNASSVTATIPAGTYIPTTDKGVANGVATLDGSSLVPAGNLPKASVSSLGAVKIGSGVNVASDGTISVPSYTASNATTSTAGVVEVAAAPAAGIPVAASRTAIGNDAQITGTTSQQIASYTPTSKGNFVVYVYFRVVTGTTNVTINVAYADGTGAQTNVMLNAQPSAVGSYSLVPLFINANSGTPIAVSVTASVANQVYASASIVGV